MIDNILMLMMENCARYDAAECRPMSQSCTPHRTMAFLRLSALRFQLKWKMLDFLTLMSCHYASACRRGKKRERENVELIIVVLLITQFVTLAHQ